MNSNKIWIWLLIDVYLPSVIAAISRGILITVIPLYLISIGFSPIQVGIGTSAISIGTLIFDLPGGIALRKMNERNLMRLSLAIITVSAFVMYLYLNSASVILFAILFGGGRSLWLLSRRYVISYYLDYSMRGRASSFVGASERIGTFIGPAIVAALIEVTSYRQVFFISFLISLIATLVNIIPDIKRFNLPKLDVKEVLTSSKNFNLSKGYLTSLSAIQFFVQGIRSSRLILLPLIGKDLLNLSDSTVGNCSKYSGSFRCYWFLSCWNHNGQKGKKHKWSHKLWNINSRLHFISSIIQLPIFLCCLYYNWSWKWFWCWFIDYRWK